MSWLSEHYMGVIITFIAVALILVSLYFLSPIFQASVNQIWTNFTTSIKIPAFGK